jgi:hypothetical protein
MESHAMATLPVYRCFIKTNGPSGASWLYEALARVYLDAPLESEHDGKRVRFIAAIRDVRADDGHVIIALPYQTFDPATSKWSGGGRFNVLITLTFATCSDGTAEVAAYLIEPEVTLAHQMLDSVKSLLAARYPEAASHGQADDSTGSLSDSGSFVVPKGVRLSPMKIDVITKWRAGKTAPEIAAAVDRSQERVERIISDARRDLGADTVPYRHSLYR